MMNHHRWYVPAVLLVFAFALALPVTGLAETKKKPEKKTTAKSVKADKKEKAKDKSKDARNTKKKTAGDKDKEKKAKKKAEGKDKKALKPDQSKKSGDPKKSRGNEMKSTGVSGSEPAEAGGVDSLLHLNKASWADFIQAGFSADQTGKIIAGRPWQRKSQLLDKGLMTEKEYEAVKDGITAK